MIGCYSRRFLPIFRPATVEIVRKLWYRKIRVEAQNARHSHIEGVEVYLKRAIAAGLVLIMLLFMVTASASPAGSTTDPLITRSYLDGAYKTALQSEITGALSGAADRVTGRLDGVFENHLGYRFAPRFIKVSLAQGDTVSLSSGASFILISGSASLSLASGTVLNISTGGEVKAGSTLSQYQRYFCAENTTARIKADSAAAGQVDGYYLIDGSGAPAAHLPFKDVPETAWFFAAVDYAYSNELFTGTSASAFSPNAPMTRAMFVTVLHRLDGRPFAPAGAGFSDVSNPSQYYYAAVAWANANDIVTGYSDGTFKPDLHVTREQMAAIIYRYALYDGRDPSTPGTVFDTFPDRSNVSGYAAHALRWTVSREIIRGSNGRLLPQNTATRAEVAQIIYNYCRSIGIHS